MDPLKFRFIKEKEGRDPSNCLESSISLEDPRPIIRDEITEYYYVFDSWADFLNWREQIPQRERCFHEVIFGKRPQRLKFDIDDLDDPARLHDITEAILDELYASYFEIDGIMATDKHLLITSSTSEEEPKNSYHIIIYPYAVENNEEAKEFTKKVINRLPKETAKYIDATINKSVQNFRLMGSIKPNSTRIKKIMAAEETREDFMNSIITVGPETTILRTLSPMAIASADDTTRELEGDATQILEYLKRYTVGHEFKERKGNLFLFKRLRPSMCEICERVHDNDNTLMISINEQDNVIFATEHCRHSEESRSLGVIGETEKACNFLGKYINSVNNGKINVHNSNYTALERGPINLYSAPNMRPYENTRTLLIKAQMKLGKTKELREYINREFPYNPNALKQPVIRMITFRQTFSRSVHELFPEFVIYSDVQGEINNIKHPRAIIQMESLHRLQMRTPAEPIDLLILDESESIFSQVCSGLHKQFHTSFATFKWLLETSKRVICMDANLNDRTANIIKYTRGEEGLLFHWNNYDRAQDDKYFITNDMEDWLNFLIKNVTEGRKIVVPMNSLRDAETVYEAISEIDGIKCRLYSSKTMQSDKDEHFSNVHRYWSELDVLIYTPTVSAGISFELAHFDMLFGYFVDASCDVETCRQMLCRVRNIISKEHYLCLRGFGNNLATTTKKIYDGVINRFYSIVDDNLDFEYSDDGRIELRDCLYLRIWLENMRITNLSRNKFVRRFIDQIADSGATIEHFEGISEKYIEGIEDLRLIVKIREIEGIANADDIHEETAIEIRTRISSQEDVTCEEKNSLYKFNLRRFYDWGSREIDYNFVSIYNRVDVKRIYRNLESIMAGNGYEDSLNIIKLRDRAHYEGANSEDSEISMSRLINYNAAYLKHRMAIQFLKICGFKNILYDSERGLNYVYERIEENIELITSQFETINAEYGIKIPRLSLTDTVKNIRALIKLISSILNYMYGTKIRKNKNIYRLESTARSIFKIVDKRVIEKYNEGLIDKDPDTIRRTSDKPVIFAIT